MNTNAYQKIIEEQDDQIQQINQIASRLKNHSISFGNQLQRQKNMINQLDQQIDQTKNKLGIVGVKLQNLLETDDTGQVCSCLMMAAITLILIVLIIVI